MPLDSPEYHQVQCHWFVSYIAECCVVKSQTWQGVDDFNVVQVSTACYTIL